MKKVKYYKDKETQGHQKMAQYIEDLKRNKYFLRDFKRYKKFIGETHNNTFFNELNNLFEDYRRLNKKAKKILERNEKHFKKITLKMAEHYGLDGNLLGFVWWSMNKERLGDYNFYDDYLDMCIYEDNYDKYLGLEHRFFADLPLLLKPADENHLRTYPVSIDIHKFASKRDVLDYIEKNWERLYDNCLSSYTGKKVRLRKRKSDRKIIDFIWTNKSLKSSMIVKLLDKEFPEHGLAYYQINKIIAIEKARRYGDIGK